MSTILKTKPLSVNKCWQGRRFKTKEYKDYEKEINKLLPKKLKIPESEYLQLEIRFGLSNFKQSDWDNPIKPFQDILSKAYGFNDNKVVRGVVEKHQVKRGEEYIWFRITPYTVPEK